MADSDKRGASVGQDAEPTDAARRQVWPRPRREAPRLWLKEWKCLRRKTTRQICEEVQKIFLDGKKGETSPRRTEELPSPSTEMLCTQTLYFPAPSAEFRSEPRPPDETRIKSSAVPALGSGQGDASGSLNKPDVF